MTRLRATILGACVAMLVCIGLSFGACMTMKRTVVGVMTPNWQPDVTAEGGFVPVHDALDVDRPKIDVTLEPVATGLVQPTDIQFVPGHPSLMIVLEKVGRARWYDLETQRRGLLFEEPVLTDSEQGLLGLAFHPQFTENGRFFVNSTPDDDGEPRTRVAEWRIPAKADLRTARPKMTQVLLEIDQPYPNHNAGQLAFGPDGYLYIGTGDGGWADDPHGNGQNTQTLLGAMLRIDVDADPAPYRVPDDNPFVRNPAFKPEIWAYGLRNPWRYTFDPQGRLVVADVGQNTYEEIHILSAGDNAGWKHREGHACFDPKENCRSEGLRSPVYSYGRKDGGSITGGEIATGAQAPALQGKYVFADFLSGRVWALDLPTTDTATRAAQAYALGRWPFLPVTFGRDAAGDVYVAGYRAGTVWRLTSEGRSDG